MTHAAVEERSLTPDQFICKGHQDNYEKVFWFFLGDVFSITPLFLAHTSMKKGLHDF